MLRQEHSTRCGWRNSRPTWWLLYVIAALLAAVGGLVETFVEGGGVRKVLETVATMGGFGLILVWLRGNRIALELEQGRRRARVPHRADSLSERAGPRWRLDPGSDMSR